VVLEGLLDAAGVGGGAGALVDAEGVPQVGDGLAGIALGEAGLAEPFQGACFIEGQADVLGDGQRLGVVVAGLAGL